jgi:hypothetical protein
MAAVGSCTSTDFETLSGCTTCDVTTHTVGAGENFLIVFVGQDQDLAATNILSASWDQTGTPQSMTAQSDNNGTGVVVGKAFTLLNPTVGNKTLRVSLTNGSGCCEIMICSLSGVDPVTPLGSIVETENTGITTSDSLAFTLNTGGLAVAFLFQQSARAGFAQGADQTQLHLNSTGCGGDCEAVMTVATVSPMNYTWNSGGEDFWHVVLPVNAASTRRAVPPMILH